ncbi:MAG: hypothetical protein GY754_31180 [bacterium]|nr:hypothetical protein [bacterium]
MKLAHTVKILFLIMLSGVIFIATPELHGGPTKKQIKANVCVEIEADDDAKAYTDTDRFMKLVDVVADYQLKHFSFKKASKSYYINFKNYIKRNKVKSFTFTATVVTVAILTEGAGLLVVLPAMAAGKGSKVLKKKLSVSSLKAEYPLLFRPVERLDMITTILQGKNYRARNLARFTFAIGLFANIVDEKHNVTQIINKIVRVQKGKESTYENYNYITRHIKNLPKTKNKCKNHLFDTIKSLAEFSTALVFYEKHVDRIENIQLGMDTVLRTTDRFDARSLLVLPIDKPKLQNQIKEYKDEILACKKGIEAIDNENTTGIKKKEEEDEEKDEKKEESEESEEYKESFVEKRVRLRNTVLLYEKKIKKLNLDMKRLNTIKANIDQYKKVSENLLKTLKKEAEVYSSKKQYGKYSKRINSAIKGWWNAVFKKAQIALIESINPEAVLEAQPTSMGISFAGGVINSIGVPLEYALYEKSLKGWNSTKNYGDIPKKAVSLARVLRVNLETAGTSMAGMLDAYSTMGNFVWNAKNKDEITEKAIFEFYLKYIVHMKAYHTARIVNLDIIKGFRHYASNMVRLLDLYRKDSTNYYGKICPAQ